MIDPRRDPDTARTVALMRAEIARVPDKNARERMEHLLDRLEAALGADGLPAPAVVHASLQRAVSGMDFVSELIGVLAQRVADVQRTTHELPGAPPAPVNPIPQAQPPGQRRIG